MHRLSLCLLPVLALLFAVQRVAADDASPRTLRVMSFNIRYGTANDGPNHWDRRRDLVVQTIRAFDPDLLGTQETLGFQKDYVAQHLPAYVPFGVGRDHGDERGEMTALFYRRERFEQLDGGHFWLSETPAVPGSISWDSSLTRMASWVKLRDRAAPGQPVLWFFNTHFDHRGGEARRQSALLLRRQISEMCGDDPVVLTGDFNAGVDSPPYLALFAADFTAPRRLLDSYRLLHPEARETDGTFNNFDPQSRRGARIDWIAVRGFKVQSAEIDHTIYDGRAPSDHWPVTAVLTPLEPRP